MCLFFIFCCKIGQKNVFFFFSDSSQPGTASWPLLGPIVMLPNGLLVSSTGTHVPSSQGQKQTFNPSGVQQNLNSTIVYKISKAQFLETAIKTNTLLTAGSATNLLYAVYKYLRAAPFWSLIPTRKIVA